MRQIIALLAFTAALGGCNIQSSDGIAAISQSSAPQTIGESALPSSVPIIPMDHEALLASPDPQLAANKRLVYDMYRIVLQGGYADRAGEFIREDYIQHNPNAAQGLAGVQDYIRKTRGEIALEERIELPLINIMAEGDHVTIAFVRSEKDAGGATYYTTWFDMFRIQDGKIAEHWDPMLKTDTPIDPNSQRLAD